MIHRALILILVTLVVAACNQKKSDVDLFTEGPVRIDLTVDPRRGYDPLYVNFSAYLETKTSTYADEISEIKWIIKGPNGYENEIVQSSFTHNEEDGNVEDFFYYEHVFRIPGRYNIQLVLNKGQYKSNRIPVIVWEKPRN
jgi:hypothetical protein